jgi:hypothetical protein
MERLQFLPSASLPMSLCSTSIEAAAPRIWNDFERRRHQHRITIWNAPCPAEASSRLAITEGSLQHEELAMRILRLFESTQEEDEVLKAGLANDRFDALEVDDEVALAQLGAAAILLWHEIGASARDELLRTANAVVGIRRAANAVDRLRRVIATHQA